MASVASLGALLHAVTSNAREKLAATRVIFFIFDPIKVPQKHQPKEYLNHHTQQ
jgi:hypothetical protein